MRNQLFILGTIVLFVTLSNCEVEQSSDQQVAEPVLQTEEIVDRQAMILECAGCHQTEYENWKKGPHANAYTSLLEHGSHVDTCPNFSDGYKQFLGNSIGKVCTDCHTGQTLYETVFLGLDKEQDPGNFNTESYPFMHKFAVQRSVNRKSDLTTGVDCLTCHKSGDKVVTNANFSPSGGNQEGQCSVQPSAFFSSNENCYTCHHHQVESMQRLVAEGEIIEEQSCSSCHQEYDEHGNGTHYWYWRKDAPDKIRPDSLNAFASITANVIRHEDKHALEVRWINNFIPHDYSECGDALAVVDVQDGNGTSLAKFTKRLNRLEAMKDLPAEHFGMGTPGSQFIFGASEPADTTLLNQDPTGGRILIEGLVKPQYWSTDKELLSVYADTIQL